MKPISAPGKRIELCTRQHQGWHSLFFAFDKLALAVCLDGEFSKESRKRFHTLYDRMVGLHLEQEKSPSKILLKKLQEEVNQEIPYDRLWMPEKPSAGGADPESADVVGIVQIGRPAQ